MNTLTEKLKLLRETKQLNQREIASKLGLSIPAYSKMETGRTDINYSRLTQLAAFFQINIADLFSIEECKEKTELLMNDLSSKLLKRQQEINALQKIAIELYDTLKQNDYINKL